MSLPLERQQHLGRRTLVIMMLRGILPGLFFIFLVILISFFHGYVSARLIRELGSDQLLNIAIPALFFIGIILSGLGYIVNVVQYSFFTFTLEEFGLRLKKGVFNIEEINIPYRQMQNIDFTRPLIYRIFGLSRLVIFSAGHEEAGEPEQTNTVFDPIDDDRAQAIKDILGRRIGVQIVQNEETADKREKAVTS